MAGQPDFIQGVDFTLYATQTAAMHNLLVSGGTPAADRGLLVVTTDTALNTPDVPNPNASSSYTKWKAYSWIRRPHSTASDTTPIAYLWNENAVSHATYLKWVRLPADTSVLEAELDALDLRVDDLEASMATALATANAANATANAASTNATNALATANAAQADADTALSDLDTPTTGVKARVTALEVDVAAAEGNITTLQTQVTNITNNLNSGLGPVFITPITVYSGVSIGPVTYDASAYVPSAAKAVILEGIAIATATGATITIRKDSGSSYYELVSAGGDPEAGGQNSSQGMYPITTNREFDYLVSSAAASTLRLIGYYL